MKGKNVNRSHFKNNGLSYPLVPKSCIYTSIERIYIFDHLSPDYHRSTQHAIEVKLKWGAFDPQKGGFGTWDFWGLFFCDLSPHYLSFHKVSAFSYFFPGSPGEDRISPRLESQFQGTTKWHPDE